MKKNHIFSVLCLCSFSSAFYATSVLADIVTLTAEGTVSFFSADISSGFTEGDRAVYELIYDTNSPNSLGNPAAYNTAISSFSVTVGSYSAISPAGVIAIYNNVNVASMGSMDILSVTSLTSDGLTGAPVGGHALQRLFFQLWDLDELWLDSVKLPTSYLSSDDYENKVFRVDFADNNFLKGNLDTFTVEISQIPVPPAIWLFGSGLISLAGVARRKKA